MATLSRTPSPAARSGSDADSVVATPLTPRAKLRALFASIDGGESDEDGHNAGTGRTSSRKVNSLKKNAAETSPRGGSPTTPTAAWAFTPLRRVGPQRPRTSLTPGSKRVASRGSGGDNDDGGSSSSSSDREVVRPRGRFAARMQAAAAATTIAKSAAATPAVASATASPEPRPAGNARERIKRMLAQAAQADATKDGGEQTEPTLDAKPSEDQANDAEDEEDDDDDIVVASTARPRARLVNGILRRRAVASPRSPTAVVSPLPATTREPSPGLFMTPSKQPDRDASPGLFMSPASAAGPNSDEDGNNDENNGMPATTTPSGGRKARFQALVARKREEARARQEAEERKRAARLAAMAGDDDDDDDDNDQVMRDVEEDDDDVSDITDDEGGRKLTQEVAGRPARKASKKALEEMHRETQRMSRNLQLAHEAKTKTKVTKATLFERFNFKPDGAAATAAAQAAATTTAATDTAAPSSSSRPTSPASPHNHTDTEVVHMADTPPSSPPVPVQKAADGLPLVDKGKGKAVSVATATEQQEPAPPPKRHVRVRLPVHNNSVLLDADNDDDDVLEIVQTRKNKLDALFDNVPLKRSQEPRSMLALRRLAQIGSPGKKPRKPVAAAAGTATATAIEPMTLGELQQVLQDRARQQAKRERDERLAALQAKGIRVQTEAEREQEMAEVEDIVARARQEAEALMQREREAAKKRKEEKKRNGGGDDNEDEEDGDYEDSDEADVLDWDESENESGADEEVSDEDGAVEEREIELSGSEEEENDEDDEDKEIMEGVLIDDEAASGEESEDGKAEDDDADDLADALEATPTRARPSKRRTTVVLSDDDDDDNSGVATPRMPAVEAKTPGPKPPLTKTPGHSDSPQVPTSVLRSATKPFIPGMPVAVGGPAGMGLTQIFAATMADDSQLAASGLASPSQFLPTLGNNVAETQPAHLLSPTAGAVPDSQPTQAWLKKMHIDLGLDVDDNDGGDDGGDGSGPAPSQRVQLDFSQSQLHGLGSLLQAPDGGDNGSASQLSDLLEPSQDMGPQNYTPLKVRFIEQPPSTIDTVVLEQGTQSSTTHSPSQPAPRTKGRLFRKADVAKIVEENEDEDEDEDDEAGSGNAMADEPATTFTRMHEARAQAKKARAAAQAFDRKKSKAKDMVEEQAEESEDEYAGLGGADGEDSDNESLASVQELIDDDQAVSATDNAKLAAFYADRERANDEKQVEKLFRDVTTGRLRRKRGAAYDLADSDEDNDGRDGGEARRRRKRRQFARMQKALFADERLSRVAANPRNQAFLKTIEDRGSDDDDDDEDDKMDFLFEEKTGAATGSTSSETPPPTTVAAATTAAVTVPDSQPTGAIPTLPAAAAAAASATTAHSRRHALGKKPATLGEIRKTLSSLLDEYDDGTNVSVVADTEFGSDDDEDRTGKNGVNNDEDDEPTASSNKENQEPARPARAPVRPYRHNVHVVDRITLKRQNSSSSSSSASSGASTIAGGSRSAFEHAGSLSGLSGIPNPTGFKVPSLLRRATTNSLVSATGSSTGSSTASSSSSSSSTPSHRSGASGAADAFTDQGKIKKTASTRSGINYFAREAERRTAMAAREARRQAKRVRSAAGRSQAMGGLFAAGKFE
ncbi:DNA replication checkpoint mediator, MRC1 domain protein [Niveomyces insectorum RCEF 264]|uniref:DNA replication checkpoint mediator, MRC1 domain protein n=1 Tax=Niveomyces insectorum RCEF 264 TaxID=1081102 RepID=A0A167VF17_9HYPO|nr:DNA replication checkpoint mediator, MRC1 domain protein [Niveomyces insectorum RCEF 264]